MENKWVMIETFLVQAKGENKEPQLALLTDQQFADFIRDYQDNQTNSIRFELCVIIPVRLSSCSLSLCTIREANARLILYVSKLNG